MSSLRIQPSPPPSLTEEDISRASVYADSDAGASTATLTGLTDKQRQKRRAQNDEDYDELNSSSDEAEERKESYPPTTDVEAESRRVEEVCDQFQANDSNTDLRLHLSINSEPQTMGAS